MKKNLLFSLSIFILLLASCTEKTRIKTDKEPNVSLESNFKNWWFYHSKNIILSSDFTALDQNAEIIPKNDFLKKLITGNFIPLKLISKNDTIYYQLFKLDENADKGISGTIKNVSNRAYQYFKMEGTPFPEFSFTDLKGNHYNNMNTKGKIVILKCWFISCKPCVAEFPQLNQLVKQYQNREDMLFISLAFDSKKELEDFLIKKPFDYAVVPDQKDFMEKTLQIHTYPTHFIIDQQGIIQKVVNKADEMISTLENKKFIKNEPVKRPPPPPPPSPTR